MSNRSGITWEKRPTQAFAIGLNAYEEQIVRALKNIADYYAPQIEAWMKNDAIWTDRTGNARQSLYAETEQLIDGAFIAFDYGVDYGFWLEYANEGRYAIIAPALNHWSPKVWDSVRALF